MRSVAVVLVLLLAGCVADPPVEPEVQDEVLPTIAVQPGWSLRCDPCDLRVSTFGNLWEPHVLADPANPDHLVAAVGDGGYIVYLSTDGGANWTRTEPLADLQTLGGPGQDWATTGDPAVAFLPDGTFVIVGLGTEQTPLADMTVQTHRDVWSLHGTMAGAYSDFGIITQSEGALVLGNPLPRQVPMEMPDREFVAAGPDGTLVATWAVLGYADTEPSSYFADLRLARSTDAGATWSDAETVHADGRPKGAFPLVLDDGVELVIYGSYRDGMLRVAQGPDWDIDILGPSRDAPHAVADGQRIAIATTIEDNGTARPALYTSDSGGDSWTGPLFIGAPTAKARHVSAAFVDDEIWVGWYDDAQQPRYVVTRVAGDEWIDMVQPASSAGPAGTYGDYVFGLNGFDGGAHITHVTRDSAGKWLHHSTLRWYQDEQ